MNEAYIYDAVRTPRGRGRKDGSLHEVTPMRVASTVLAALRDRNALDTAAVDDVILGCVEPVQEQGADIARLAVLMAASQVISGSSELAIGGGVESMSRVPMMSGGGAWPADPQVAFATYFVPQGVSADLIATRHGFSRDDVDRYAVASQQRAARAWDGGYFEHSVTPVKDQNELLILDRDELERRDLETGLATLCVGAGMGTATIIERV